MNWVKIAGKVRQMLRKLGMKSHVHKMSEYVCGCTNQTLKADTAMNRECVKRQAEISTHLQGFVRAKQEALQLQIKHNNGICKKNVSSRLHSYLLNNRF